MARLDDFRYEHLPQDLQRVSRLFHDLAHELADMMPGRLEQHEVALQKLLEAKDAAVRSHIPVT